MKIQLFKDKEKALLCARIAFLSLLPLLTCLIYVIASGHWLTDISLRSSSWNDELFYYKQIESIIRSGFPRGFFGFNESTAGFLSFAAWSPVLVLPYVLFTLIFGISPIRIYICNILIYSLAVMIYGILTKPDLKKTLVLSVLFALYPLNARYCLSAMPEVAVWSLLIVFYALAVSYTKEKRLNRPVAMLVISVLLTIMRPYFILLILLPSVLLFFFYAKKGKHLIPALVCAGSVLFSVGVYYLINRFLAAPYFSGIYDTRWVHVFLDKGIFAGIANLWSLISVKFLDTFYRIRTSLIADYQADGTVYFLYAILVLIFISLVIYDAVKKRKDSLLINLHFLATLLIMLIAVWVMYLPAVGSKHLLTFIVVGIFLFVSLYERPYAQGLVFSAALIISLLPKWSIYPEYRFPVAEPSEKENSAYWSAVYKENIILNKDNSPNWDNSVIWVYFDTIDDGSDSYREMNWSVLYDLPAGIGVSCCYPDYVREALLQGNLKSKYVTTVTDGTIDRLLADDPAFSIIGRDSTVTTYKRDQ